jgi:hypothetical protein
MSHQVGPRIRSGDGRREWDGQAWRPAGSHALARFWRSIATAGAASCSTLLH